jgi:hypothetical protein
MSFGGRIGDEIVVPKRAIGWLLVSAFGLAACVTVIFLSMRAVMDIGGACASVRSDGAAAVARRYRLNVPAASGAPG